MLGARRWTRRRMLDADKVDPLDDDTPDPYRQQGVRLDERGQRRLDQRSSRPQLVVPHGLLTDESPRPVGRWLSAPTS